MGCWYPCWAQLWDRYLQCWANNCWSRLSQSPVNGLVKITQKKMCFDLIAVVTLHEEMTKKPTLVCWSVESLKTRKTVQTSPACPYHPWCPTCSSTGLRVIVPFRVGASHTLHVGFRSRLSPGEGHRRWSEASCHVAVYWYSRNKQRWWPWWILELNGL